MDPFAPRDDAALDYWFWKFHVGDLAFLVDVIIRRRSGTSETRVSYWLRGAGSVLHEPAAAWSAEHDCHQRRWDRASAWSIGRHGRRRPMGSSVVAWCDPRVTAARTDRTARTVRHLDRRLATSTLHRHRPGRCRAVRGPGHSRRLHHYWGRRLLERWVWLSATQFDGQPQRRLEGIVGGRSRLFGWLPSRFRSRSCGRPTASGTRRSCPPSTGSFGHG